MNGNGNGNGGGGGFKVGAANGGRHQRQERTYVDDLAYVGITALATATVYVVGDYLEAWWKISKIKAAADNMTSPNQQQTAQAA